jgi:ATP-binding cassette, subfamily B, multidrug efflux pump
MHNHGPIKNVSQEKTKDLKKTIHKLFKYLHNYSTLIIIALILSSLGSIFAIIGPNKLSDLTNKISDGLVLNKDKFQELTTDISGELTQDKMMSSIPGILNINLDKETLSSITNIDDMKILNEVNTTHNILLINKLSDDTKNKILKDSEYNDVIITSTDKITLLNILNDTSTDKSQLFMNIPENILASLLSTSTIDNIEVTNFDKAKFINIMSQVQDKSNVKELYNALDKMPTSINTLIKPSMDLNGIKNICIFLLILYLFSALFNFLQGFIMATVSNQFAKELRNKLSLKINKLPLKYFDSHETGDILSRVTNDVDMVSTSMNQSFGTLVGAITLFIGSIIMMFYTNWLMAITAIISSFIGFGLMTIILSKSQKYFNQRQVELGKLNAHISEIYTAHMVVKAYNGESNASNKFDELNKSVYDCNLKSQFLSGLMQPIMAFIGNFSYVCVCVVGAMLVINSSITFGVIVAFIIYIRLFTNPLTEIAQGMTELQSTTAASERVFDFLEEPELTDETNLTKKLDITKVKGNIEFSHVKFGYNSNKIIIKDFNAKIKPGDKIAIVGPTGAGKTTMVNLLMKFYNINSGDIKIDGTSIHDLTRENIHDLFIMVLQDTWLFNGTIRDNIKYNKDNVTDKEIWSALEMVGVDHFVKSLPDTLDYEIQETDSISAGQKQLLTIARGMIKNAPFLILDEATSSVDTRTEELVQHAMDKLTEGRTSFIIAHRLSTIKNADLILVMNEGNIIEQGSHEELMKENGFYADLYNSQFQN